MRELTPEDMGQRSAMAERPDGASRRALAQTPRVVIVGAGFAGLSAAKELADQRVRVTLVDRHNHHLFQPLLYQVATAALEPADISAPLRQRLRANNIEIMMAEVTGVDMTARRVAIGPRSLEFDFLLLATGSTHSYFGHPEWAGRAPGLKTLEDALEIRRRVLYAYEAAEQERDPELQKAWLTFVVVGGGPTGVELAGALASIARESRKREFKHIDLRRTRILLLEGLPRVLTAYPEDLSQRALRSLERLGVEVKTNTKVSELTAEEVKAEALVVRAQTVIWAAGVAASPLARCLGAELDRAGRVRVTPELTLPGRGDVFVLGDLAAFEQDGQMLPGLAPIAMAQGKHAARNILRQLRGQPPLPFRYRDRGSFAVIGRGAAVGMPFQRWKLSGPVAWLLWLLIHITFLIGFRNRVAVLFNWAYLYLTRRRHAEIIVGAGDLTQPDLATTKPNEAAEPRPRRPPAPRAAAKSPPSSSPRPPPSVPSRAEPAAESQR